MGREKFSSRLGFILISAGCAIGLGNVWRFPYIVGQYGGAAFVLIYILFLAIMGLPIVAMEFAVGRASQKSAALSFDILEPKGSKWHIEKYFAMAGNYVLMMFYTTVAGWMICYFFKMLMGDFAGLNADQVAGEFSNMLADPLLMLGFMVLVVVGCFAICAQGLQGGVEKITKWMMVCLLLLMVVLAGNSVLMEGSGPGLEFYLKPDFSKMTGLEKLSLQVGWLQAFQNDRKYVGEYVTPGGAQIELKVQMWKLGIFNTLYAGKNLMPYYVADPSLDYGPGLYWGEPWYRTENNIYDRLEIYWEPIRNDIMKLRVASVHHFDGKKWGWQQKVLFSIDLGQRKLFKNKK